MRGMTKTRVQEYQEKYAEQSIRLTPHALKKTGLVPSQVFLKIDDYLLICAPFQISMTRGIFLVVLMPQEITFFQQFQGKLCSMNLTFQPAGKKPLTLLVRASLDRVGPVKGKQNVCMMDALIKSCPNDLVEIIGDYITTYDGLKTQFESFKDKQITMDETNAKLMRFNNYAELTIGQARTRATVLMLSVTNITLRPSIEIPGIEVGAACAVRLYFQVYQFTVNGSISSVQRGTNGQSVVTAAIDFAAELTEIVDDFFFRTTMNTRTAQP